MATTSAPHPFDRQDINEHLVLFVDSSETLACMALVCPAWWHAARRAAGYRLRALAGHTGTVLALASLPGGLVASGSDDCTVHVWEAGSGRLVRTLAGHTDRVIALAGLPGGALGERVVGQDGCGLARCWRCRLLNTGPLNVYFLPTCLQCQRSSVRFSASPFFLHPLLPALYL